MEFLQHQPVRVGRGALHFHQLSLALELVQVDVALPHQVELAVGGHLVRIGLHIDPHGVRDELLSDVRRNHPLVESLLGQVHVVVVRALVAQDQGPVDVPLDGLRVGSDIEHQLVEPEHVVIRLYVPVAVLVGAVGHHRRPSVHHVDGVGERAGLADEH